MERWWINGLSSEVVIQNFDFNDTIRIAGLGGDDVIDASGIGQATARHLILDGGDGDDILDRRAAAMTPSEAVPATMS